MIRPNDLKEELTRQLKRLEDDLRERVFDAGTEAPELKPQLQAEWQAARDAERTAETFESWTEQVLTQAGVHWLLSCVFIRFIEDNGLVERPWLAGTPESGRLALARDRHEAYFRAHPAESDREYLIAAFREAGELPGLHTFFDEAHNPVFRLPISGPAAMALRQFWQQVDPNTGMLAHDFTDPAWNTRFLGDLYQDLSEATRKRYALLQTPEFVEEFILDRTLTPAIREFGFREVRMIDPTCGSGHFLLGAFHRLVDAWARGEPGRNRRDLAQKALDAVAGVDLNPFAVAIARFRLLVAALKVSDVHRLSEAPNFKLNVAIGDSLLHGKRFGLTATEGMFEGSEHYAGTGLAHAYANEDLQEVNRILGRQYHVTCGNPPYIVVKDAALNAVYRQRYASCHMKYSLGAPFTERFFELAITGNGGSAGYVGLITTNSFMKREFGSKLIEQVLPRVDLTHIVDSSGATIPGHNRDGTATVILFGRHRAPLTDSVRVVMGIKSDPTTAVDPARGPVWSAIVSQINQAGADSEFVSVADMPRATLAKHPWSIGGGGTADLLEALNDASAVRLRECTTAIGRTTHTGEDAAFFVAKGWARRHSAESWIVPLVEGEAVRDYVLASDTEAVFPYDQDTAEVEESIPAPLVKHTWAYRTHLRARSDYGNNIEDRGLRWYEHSMFFPDRFRVRLGIAYADIATHNHFVLDRGGKVFNRTAPVIKLPVGSSEGDHFGLLGLLNSSVACFWLKQVCFPKDGQGQMWEERFAFNATNVAEFPLPATRPTSIARKLDELAQNWTRMQPSAVLSTCAQGAVLNRRALDAARREAHHLHGQMIALQEELDWTCYGLFGLVAAADVAGLTYTGDLPSIALGERAFEVVLARRVASGEAETNWFERHGTTPVTSLPSTWPPAYRAVVERRISLIHSDASIRLLEQPLYKRRWSKPLWGDLEHLALREWLLDRLEAPHLWPADDDHPPQLTTVNRLADAVRGDAGFMQIAELYAGHSGFDVAQVVAELVAGESVPFLPVLRYAETGLRKRAQWEATWDLQRKEDAIDAEVVAEEAPGWRAELTTEARTRFSLAAGQPLTAEAAEWVEARLAAEIKRYQDERKAEEVGKIPVPPKYQSKDFQKADYWRLRGGLDVPKERWVSYPGCERGADTSLVLGWAGWNHLQQATALAAYYLDMKDNEGWPRERLQPLLAGLLELVPWLKQWHNEVDPTYGERMGDYYEGFLSDQARELGFTVAELRAWQPAPAPRGRGRRRAGAAS